MKEKGQEKRGHKEGKEKENWVRERAKGRTK